MNDIREIVIFASLALVVLVLNVLTNKSRGGAAGGGGKPGLGDMQTIVKHVRQLNQEAVDRIKDMNAQGASTEDITRATFTDYDTCSDQEKRALCMLIDKMRAGDLKMKGSTPMVETRVEKFKIDKDALARARQLHADGAETDGICREIIPEYGGWDSEKQAKTQQALNKFLEKA